MADVIRRSDCLILSSVHTPDYPEPDWKVIDRATLDALQSVPQKYRTIDAGTDAAREMTATEKGAVDAAGLEAHRTMTLRDMALTVTDYLAEHYPDAVKQTLMAYWTEGIQKNYPDRCAIVQTVMDWVDSVLAAYYAKRDEITACTTVAEVDAVAQPDYPGIFDAADPGVTAQQVRGVTS